MLFSEFPLLAHLNETQRQNLESACEIGESPPGTRLITQGVSGEKLFFLLEGSVEVKVDAGGEENLVATLEAPAIVGEMELLTGDPRSASVYAKTQVRCARLDFETLRARIDDGDPAALKFVYRIAQVLATRVAVVSRKLSELASSLHPRHAEDLAAFRAKVFSEWDL